MLLNILHRTAPHKEDLDGAEVDSPNLPGDMH